MENPIFPKTKKSAKISIVLRERPLRILSKYTSQMRQHFVSFLLILGEEEKKSINLFTGFSLLVTLRFPGV